MTETRTVEPATSTPIFQQCFTPPGLDQICITISYDPAYPTQIQLCVSYGGDQWCTSIDIADVACIPIGVEDVGLEVCFDNWNVNGDQVCFNITVKACAFLCITLASFGPICFSTDALNRLRDGSLSDDDRAALKRAMAMQARIHARQAELQSSGRCGC